MKNPCCGLRGALGALGVSRGTPLAPKMLQNTVFPTLAEHLKEPCALCSAGTRTKKMAMVLSPKNMFSKSWRWFCPPRAPAKKLAMVSSLRTLFQKMPMAPATGSDLSLKLEVLCTPVSRRAMMHLCNECNFRWQYRTQSAKA